MKVEIKESDGHIFTIAENDRFVIEVWKSFVSVSDMRQNTRFIIYTNKKLQPSIEMLINFFKHIK